MSGDLVRTNGHAVALGTTEREEFGATEVMRSPETASTAVAAQATAAIQARYVMAMRNPRDWDTVRVKLLRECDRTSFAAVARYRKPIGQGVEGPSIRFAEAALRCMGNAFPETMTIYDDPEKRIIRQLVTDLESNLTYSKDIVIDKTVERSQLKSGQTPLRVRENSSGRMTYLVPATEDDLLNKENALTSKALRTNALRILPGDILEECMLRVKATLMKDVASDPDAYRKKLADSFASISIMPNQLKEYLGHDLAASTPAEMTELRSLFVALSNGEANWADAMAAKNPEGSGDDKKPSEAATKLRDKLTKKEHPKPVATSAPADADKSGDLWSEVVIAYGSETTAYRALNAAGFESWADVPKADMTKLALDLISEAKR